MKWTPSDPLKFEEKHRDEEHRHPEHDLVVVLCAVLWAVSASIRTLEKFQRTFAIKK